MLALEDFVDRDEQLDFLEKKYRTEGFECVIIYGRRRVGKTALTRNFISDKEHIYHLVNQEEKSVQLRRVVKSVYSKYGDVEPRIDDWHEFFDYFTKVVDEKIVFVLDEFPYLIEQNKSIPSLFQSFIDEHLLEKDMLLILCGSSISMMESLMTSDSPLYGRRTGQIDLKPFNFEHVQNFLKKRDMKEKIEFYSVFGGTPFYLQMIDPELSLTKNIIEKICDDKEILHEEPWMLLKQEFERPHRYMSILEAIAQGYTTPKRIADQISIPPQSVPKYLGELERIRMVKHLLPVTERNKRSRKGIYALSDNFFDFWFNFIAPNISDVEKDPLHFVESSLMDNIDAYVGKKFEEVCHRFVRKLSRGDRLSSRYPRIGRWWYKEDEIDIVALNDREDKILFGECKWSKNKVTFTFLNDLKTKAKKVRWKNVERKEKYALVSKSGFTDSLKEYADDSDDLELYSLDDMKKIFGS